MTVRFEEMLASPSPSSGIRLAALMLHALPIADREWVLANLAESQRQALEPTLRELRDLGIPVEAAANLSFGQLSRSHRGIKSLREGSNPHAGHAAALADLLRGEPSRLVDAALALQTQTLRDRVAGALSRPTPVSLAVPPRMARSLLGRLEQHAKAQEYLSPDAPESRLWRSRIVHALNVVRQGCGRVFGFSGDRLSSQCRADERGVSR